ncbi:EF-hand domain-containing protein [Sphingobium fluviale]|nr:EF-hand domain-containing protein [Sphingobium fluviale]
MIRLTVLSAAALTVALALPATAAPARGIPDNAIEQLRSADRNHDGQVSRAELVGYRATQWSRFDRNGDGHFSRDDLPGFAQSRWDGEKLAGLRHAYDRDGDGMISRAEFVNGPTPAFDMADANRDGLVSEDELRALSAKMRN